jgi:outer membrane protein W
MRHLAAVVALALAVAAPLHAQDQRIRLQGIWVSPSGGFEGQGLSIDVEGALGGRVAWEHLWSSRYGLELAAATSVHGSRATFDEAGLPVSDARILPLTAAFNLHLPSGGKSDLFVGAGLAYVRFSNVEVAFPGEPNQRFKVDDDLTWLAQAGLDLPLGRSLGLSLGLQYLAADAKLHVLGGTADVAVEPWVVATGLLIRF